MVLGGLALALSRLIDNSVVVLENIYPHLEMGEPPHVAAETGGKEVALPVLASTLTTAVVFFPVTLLAGVSKFLFSAMALAVVVSLFASYFVAMTVVPLFCARYLKARKPGASQRDRSGRGADAEDRQPGWGARFNAAFNAAFNRMLGFYEALVQRVLRIPATVLVLFFVGFRGEPAALQPTRVFVLPANRRGSVCDHLQGAFGNQAHRHRERSRRISKA